MTLFSHPVAAADSPSAAAEPAPPGGHATAPGPAPAWDHHASYMGGAWSSKPAGDDTDRGFADYLRRQAP